MQIPDFKKAVNADISAASDSVLKPLPALAAVQINNSRLGFLLYLCSYSAFAFSLLLVFYPFVIERPLWLFGLIVCWGGLWWAYRLQVSCCITGAFGFSGNHWVLEQDGVCCQLELAGEVLCWRRLIILPLREPASGKIQWLLLFGDALSSSDNARLRRWLRACLTPKA